MKIQSLIKAKFSAQHVEPQIVLESHDIENHTEITNEWKYEPHSQLGSNPGGLFIDPNGEKHYIKFYKNPKQVESEYAATMVHKLMGVRVLDIKIVICENDEFVGDYSFRGIHKGSLGILSPWNPNLKVLGSRFYQINEQDAEHLGRSYIAAVLCENWDIVGLEIDNQVRDSVTKELISVDHGGSFHFRAQGGAKNFDHDDIASHKTLRKYSPARDVFDYVFEKFPEAEHNAVARLHMIHHEDLVSIFEEAGFANAGHMADVVMSRVERLLEHYGH